MTNKEAIEIIQHNTNVGYGIVIEGATEKINQALDRAIKTLEGWDELKETIKELSENEGVLTQQEVCKFLVNLMGVIEGCRE